MHPHLLSWGHSELYDTNIICHCETASDSSKHISLTTALPHVGIHSLMEALDACFIQNRSEN